MFCSSKSSISFHCLRQRANVAEDLSDVIKKRTGEETVVSDPTYDLRSGGPDFTDRLVATTFGTIALDAARHPAHLRQFARVVTLSGLRRGVREYPIEVAADEAFLLAGPRPLNREIVSTFL